MEKLKVMVVEDSSFYKKILVQAVEDTGLGLVEHTASSSSILFERLKQRKIDVVLLEFRMREMSGIDILKNLRIDYPDVYVIMVSAGKAGSVAGTAKALEMGALDFILKPMEVDAKRSVIMIKNRLQGLFTQIITVKYTTGNASAVNLAETAKLAFQHPPAPGRQVAEKKKLSGVDLIVIAASTGGPVALETICKKLPADFNKPILVVQHMPAEFTRKLAQSLDKKCALPVVEAEEGALVKPGQVMIAPGGVHMTVQTGSEAGRTFKLKAAPPVNGVRPSADVLFSSVAKAYKGRRVLAVILTGMGSDGMLGVKEMKRTCTCYCLVQSEKTCVVHGMPKSVVDAGLADDVEDIDAITARVLCLVRGGS
ncbi:chemotaxis-specific protein-glutamate methyltransferase CheB [Pelotomaculum sp. PtaB.Bin117]|uniref:chemotaxis-specific protein-glutamate methyltransferase CheB n=1 Tax=Pelotomaculum sp. PtaB.Bin117 TaxID=1811694 RepID=UPI00257C5C37|nr:chemotaxis-specific protein-glutamate methyltransferase CheB [Pelotomaculum sp. PtaB.Bin117]